MPGPHRQIRFPIENAAAITALPHPANVSQNVPIASAAYFFVFMSNSSLDPGEPDHFFRYEILVVPMVPLKANGALSK